MTSPWTRRATVPATCALAGALLLPAPSTADCCMGPPVSVGVKPNTHLATALRLDVEGDDPDHTADATIRPYLKVGTHRIARLPDFDVHDVGVTAQHPTLRIPAKAVRDARRYGKRAHHRRAVLTFVVRGATEKHTGAVSRTYGLDSFLLLDG